ncbi:MAG: ABC transporter permease [Myxococcaceae bacterium]|nr:ABC transporter permease [Myxococcaceae bacterium]
MLQVLDALLKSTLEAAPALVFAALGAVISERAGVVNVGIEGMMRAGAFAAAVAALVMPTPAGVVVGMLAGATLALLHAWLCIRWRADQVVSGMAINLVMLALGTFVLEARFSPNGTPSIAQLDRYLTGVPFIGGFTALTVLALAAPFALHGVIQRTRFGLRLRAAGEKPQAVAAMGVSVSRLRYLAVVCSGLLAGLGGATLSVAVLDRFEHHMPSGLGFMAVAAMVFGRWTPLGAAGAALFFSFGSALRIGLTSSAPGVLEVVPQGFLMALPYLLTLALLAAQKKGAGQAPAALGTPYDPELR